MKAIVIIVFLVCVALFYPTYDLVVKTDFFSDDFSLQESGFMTHKGCHQAAFDAKVKYYRCDKKTLWHTLFSTATSYDPEQRYKEPQQFKDLHWEDKN